MMQCSEELMNCWNKLEPTDKRSVGLLFFTQYKIYFLLNSELKNML